MYQLQICLSFWGGGLPHISAVASPLDSNGAFVPDPLRATFKNATPRLTVKC